MVDPTQYLRMQNMFGINPAQQTSPVSPWNNVNFGAPQSTSVPSSPNMGPPNPPNLPLTGDTPPLPNAGGAPIQRPDIQDANPNEYDAAARLQQLYHPETLATTKYSQMASEYPKLDEFRPSIMRRLGGALISVAGGLDPRGMAFYHMNPQAMQTGEQFTYAPYEKKLEDWKNQIGPALQSAQLERYQNVNARQSAMGVISDELKNRAQNEKAANDQAKADISASRAEAYRLKSLGYEFDFSGPTVKIKHPSTGQIITTPIQTGHMSDMDKEVLKHKDKMEEKAAAPEKGVPFDIPDPSDPTGKARIPVMVAPSGRATRITLETPGAKGQPPTRQPVNAPLLKPGTEPAPPSSANLQAIQDSAKETLNTLNSMLDEKDQLRPNIAGAVGASRMLGLQHIPGSETRTADVTIRNLKSNMLLGLINKMKTESKSGTTGFGRLTNKEVDILNQAATRLDPSTDRESFRQELLRIREKLQKIIQNPDGSPTTPANSSAQDLIKLYSDPNYKPKPPVKQ